MCRVMHLRFCTHKDIANAARRARDALSREVRALQALAAALLRRAFRTARTAVPPDPIR